MVKKGDNSDANLISKQSPIGYILKVDLEYPDELHKLHDYYPLSPEKLAIPYDLSDYCKKIADKHGIKVGDVKKLISNLGDKTNYVVHYRNLQLYVSLGIKLTKSHKVLKFKKSDGMKIYTDFNPKKGKNLLIVLKKNFFKLMINSAYGKTMENLKKRINIRLVNKQKSFLKHIFDKNYAAIHEIKSALALNKPIHVGFTIIELSKRLMYDFHYNFI